MPDPASIYAAQLRDGSLLEDAVQAKAVASMQRIYTELRQQERPAWMFWRRGHSLVRGLYLWGGVGIGKTCLMNFLYQCLANSGAQRLHFHRFMYMVHNELKQRQGESDPLSGFARSYARKVRILLFDEFYVSDITDAMLLANLLQALFANGVSFVATSNQPPGMLYHNGLQRDRFLPAIELIEQNTEVLHMDSDTDYRSRYLQSSGVYYHPANKFSHDQLQRYFERFTKGDSTSRGVIIVNGRELKVLGHGDDCVWLSFMELCDTPRNTADYIELASLYPVLLLSDVPELDEDNDDATRRFIALIDELYERRVKLVMSAAVPAAKLYHGRCHSEIFQRTVSRLNEMGGQEYLGQAHLG